jgi:hypothetical protein
MRLKPDLKLIGAVALAAIGVSIAAAPKARADQDWQCGIILCMAKPAGPTAAGPSCISDMNEQADPFRLFLTTASAPLWQGWTGTRMDPNGFRPKQNRH